jgi:outer membrane lipoprotein SlyB
MNPHPTSPLRGRQHPLLIAAALAVILFCAVGTAAIMGWLPSSSGGNRGQLSDADRAALAASLQQPGQPAYPAQGTLPAAPLPAQTVPAAPSQSLAATSTYPVYPAQPAQPVYAPGTAAYGSSSQGSTASGYAPAQPAQPDYAPVAPVRETPRPRTEPKTTRVAQADTDSGSRWCSNCGNVESVRTITTRAQGSGVGAAGGAILGGLLGNQIGSGHGRQLATVAGAVGGAVMGNQVEGNMKASHSYEIRVRLDDGTLRTFHQRSAPQWRTGDRVRIVKGSLRAA